MLAKIMAKLKLGIVEKLILIAVYK